MTYWPEQELTPWLDAVKAGEVVAAPAEGVYGYCCDPFNTTALDKIIDLKQRSGAKGFVTLIPDVLWLGKLCSPLPEATLRKIYDLWGNPELGPVTIALPARPDLPTALTGEFSTIAVRLPHVDYVLEYLKAWDAPLVSTSANISGQEPIRAAADLPADVTRLAHKGELPGGVSGIYDIAADKWLREPIKR